MTHVDKENRSLDLAPSQLAIVKDVVARFLPGCEVRAFGSRVGGRAGRFSDLDLVVVGTGPLPYELLGRVRDAFSESDLPFRVDVLDWATLSAGFREIVNTRYETLGRPDPPV